MYSHYLKRFFDLVTVVALVVLFSWLLVLILFVYLFTNELPVFFSNPRIGKNGKIFIIWKFRTLSIHENKSLKERRFLLGEFLRMTNLDELPQIWNVVKGEMSFIGPRPLPVEYLPLMNENQKNRYHVFPGITGWAQINGRHSISWQRKFELDNYYVKHISFGLDMLILFKTIILLLSFRKDISLAEEKFKGN